MNDLLDGGQGGDRRRTARMRAALPQERALRVRLHRTVVALEPGTLPDPIRPVEDGRKAAASGGGICIAQPTLCQPSRKILPVSDSVP